MQAKLKLARIHSAQDPEQEFHRDRGLQKRAGSIQIQLYQQPLLYPGNKQQLV